MSINNGGKTSYYDLPINPTTLDDLIEFKKMPFWQGNIFKATYALTERALRGGGSEIRELNKIIYYAERRLAELLKNIQN